MDTSSDAQSLMPRYRAALVLKNQYRAGYSRPLLWFDFLLLALVLIDAFDLFTSSGNIPLMAMRYFSFGEFWRSDLVLVALFAFLMLFIVPALIGAVRIWFGYAVNGNSSEKPRQTVTAHIAICVLVSFALVEGHAAEILSGGTSGAGFLFNSALYNVLVGFDVIRWVYAGFGLFLVYEVFIGLIHYVIEGEELARPIRQYLVRAELADVPIEWVPLPSSAPFDSNSNGNRVRLVEEIYSNKIKHFQRLDSGEQTRLADNELAQCAQSVLSRFVEPGQTPGAANQLSVEFFIDPRSAFESALTHTNDRRRIVVSPYVSPSLKNLLCWHGFLSGDEVRPLEFSSAKDYYRPWPEQQSLILDCLRNNVSNPHTSAVFVMSEVFHASGRRIPLIPFIETLRSTTDLESLYVIVDGTDAVGNNSLVQTAADWNCYVFSSQRWLMAAEECSIVLYRGGKLDQRQSEAPGAIRIGNNTGGIQYRAIAGIRSTIEAIEQQKDGFQFLFSRCNRLVKELRLDLPPVARIVGDGVGNQTFVIACCPKDDHRWRLDDPSQLEDELLRRRVKASVVKLDPFLPWVRMALPFYLDAGEINRFSKFLKDTIN